MLRFLLLAAMLCSAAACHDQARGGTGARRQIAVVGSSTVFPFTALIAERFAGAPGAAAPVIESTGTGAGIRLFCAGVGAGQPDIVDASRRMRASEYRRCRANGAGGLIEAQIGLDGIALGQAPGGAALSLTAVDLYRALAAAPHGRANAARTWHDVNPRLPRVPIQVYGPPATSGTRDALAELMLGPGCDAFEPGARLLALRDPEAHRARCARLRQDGAYVDAGENDNFVIQKLQASPGAIGVFGYSYLAENRAAVRGIAIDGVPPDYRSIASGRYPGSRPLFVYVKQAHLDAVPGLRRFLATYAGALGPDGPLVRRGLIAAPAQIRARSAAALTGPVLLDPASLS